MEKGHPSFGKDGGGKDVELIAPGSAVATHKFSFIPDRHRMPSGCARAIGKEAQKCTFELAICPCACSFIEGGIGMAEARS